MARSAENTIEAAVSGTTSRVHVNGAIGDDAPDHDGRATSASRRLHGESRHQ